MWEEVGLEEEEEEVGGKVVDGRVMAAIYLQHTMDNELGGWMNTFG